jgi:hypothetical protein
VLSFVSTWIAIVVIAPRQLGPGPGPALVFGL